MSELLHESASYFVVLSEMESIVKHSFIVHKSVSYLDLNIGHNLSSRCGRSNLYTEGMRKSRTFKNNFVSTRESSKKNLAKNRTVLYTYHLDMSTQLESGESKIEKQYFEGIYEGVALNGVIISSGLFERRLYEIIASYLLKTREVNFVKSILKIMKFVNLPRKSVLLNRCSEILNAQNADAGIINELFAKESLQESDMFYVKPKILEYYLRHSDCKDWNNEEFHRRQQWINHCMYSYRFEHVSSLLKYYNSPRFSEYVYNKTKNSLRILSGLSMYEMEMPVEQGWITQERNLLVLQTLDIFYSSAFSCLENSSFQTSGSEALRLVWSSIPDVLISRDELELFYRDTRLRRDIKPIHNFYKRAVKETTLFPQPRLLADYCRILIRNTLSQNQLLPEGIAQLGLPDLVQSFLNLENTWLR